MGSESDKKSKVEVAPKPEAVKEQAFGSDKGKQPSSEKPSPGAERFKGEGAPKPEAAKEQAFGNEKAAKNSSEKPSSGTERMKSDRASDSTKVTPKDSGQIKNEAALSDRNFQLQNTKQEIANLHNETKQLQAEKRQIQADRQDIPKRQEQFDKLSPKEKDSVPGSDRPNRTKDDVKLMEGRNREREIDHTLKEASTKLDKLEGQKEKLEHERKILENNIKARAT